MQRQQVFVAHEGRRRGLRSQQAFQAAASSAAGLSWTRMT
jgi:hypothetical protein